MPRPSEVKPKLPDVLEQADKFQYEGSKINESVVAHILDDVAALKAKIEKDKLRYETLLEELLEIQSNAGLSGLRHNNIVFTAQLQDGRRTLDQKLYEERLLDAGVHISVIKKAKEESTKQGESIWVRKLRTGDEEE